MVVVLVIHQMRLIFGGYSGSTEGDQVLEFTSPSSTIKVLTD